MNFNFRESTCYIAYWVFIFTKKPRKSLLISNFAREHQICIQGFKGQKIATAHAEITRFKIRAELNGKIIWY